MKKILIRTIFTGKNDEQQLDENNMWENLDSNHTECILCDRNQRRRKGLSKNTVKATTDSMKKRIIAILEFGNHTEKVHKVRNSTSISYHSSCFAEYEHKLFYENRIKTTSNPLNIWTTSRLAHEKSFAAVKDFVNEKLVDAREVHSLRYVHRLYSSFFDEEFAKHQAKLCPTSYTRQHLCTRLLSAIPNLTKTVYKQRTFIHRNDLNLCEILASGFRIEDDLLAQIKSVAFEIRKNVLSQEKRYLPKHTISVENIYEGECAIPKELYTFISCLAKGPKNSTKQTLETKINSICHSIMYTMTKGAIKPSTCLSLGLVTKSITGSRRMIEILNRLGHCVSYSVVEELETEIAYGCAASSEILPHGMVSGNPSLRTHVAFDNFDKFVETSSGKDTLHDTVYQNVVQDRDPGRETEKQPPSTLDHTERQHPPNTIDHTERQRRRRKYQSNFDCSIVPYVRKSNAVFRTVGTKCIVPDSLPLAVDLNNLWMFQHALDVDGVKRWFAWNSERIVDTNPIQKIGYLPNLNMSPTSDSVVLKTLDMALTIANECEQTNVVVTYDLAIACRAYRIQADMAPKFDRIFINLGSFHIELSFFKVRETSKCIL